jgi:hypothetical protein
MNSAFERTLIAFSIIFIASHAIFEINYRPNGIIPSMSGSGAKNTTNEGTNDQFVPPTGPLSIPNIEQEDLIYNDSRNTVPFVNEEFKVIFFQVAKAASSEWTRFFARLAGNPEWCGADIHNDKVNKIKKLTDFSKNKARKMMLDPSWTKAIFVRNPKTRLLSAFLDKAVSRSKVFADKYCRHYEEHGGDLVECVKKHEDFDFFIHNITTVISENVHWRPIYTRIDDKWWPYINYIANMENLSDDAAHFLQSIKSTKDGTTAWGRIGKIGWSDNERDCNTMGEKSFLQQKDTRHQTNAEDKLRSYYTPELEKFVEERYWMDFHNPYFHFTPMKLYPEN